MGHGHQAQAGRKPTRPYENKFFLTCGDGRDDFGRLRREYPHRHGAGGDPRSRCDGRPARRETDSAAASQAKASGAKAGA
jgi:hypothetical protein